MQRTRPCSSRACRTRATKESARGPQKKESKTRAQKPTARARTKTPCQLLHRINKKIDRIEDAIDEAPRSINAELEQLNTAIIKVPAVTNVALTEALVPLREALDGVPKVAQDAALPLKSAISEVSEQLSEVSEQLSEGALPNAIDLSASSTDLTSATCPGNGEAALQELRAELVEAIEAVPSKAAAATRASILYPIIGAVIEAPRAAIKEALEEGLRPVLAAVNCERPLKVVIDPAKVARLLLQELKPFIAAVCAASQHCPTALSCCEFDRLLCSARGPLKDNRRRLRASVQSDQDLEDIDEDSAEETKDEAEDEAEDEEEDEAEDGEEDEAEDEEEDEAEDGEEEARDEVKNGAEKCGIDDEIEKDLRWVVHPRTRSACAQNAARKPLCSTRRPEVVDVSIALARLC